MITNRDLISAGVRLWTDLYNGTINYKSDWKEWDDFNQYDLNDVPQITLDALSPNDYEDIQSSGGWWKGIFITEYCFMCAIFKQCKYCPLGMKIKPDNVYRGASCEYYNHACQGYKNNPYTLAILNMHKTVLQDNPPFLNEQFNYWNQIEIPKYMDSTYIPIPNET